MIRITGVAVRGACLTAMACGALLQVAGPASAAPPPIKHVFIIVEENESEATTFGPGSPAPYLSKTLVGQGAYLSNYYGIGHHSLDNYIGMVSGQAPNPSTSADCGTFADFTSPSMNGAGQENGSGCVYPTDVPTLMGQLDTAGLTWKGYMDSMGTDPVRDNTGPGGTCGHPAVGAADPTEGQGPTDQYATKHDPFVYFHSVIDNSASCDAHVVPLTQLSTDLQSAATTPNYTFITPGLCNDGHDSTCQSGSGGGGLAQVDTFLKTWVPQITSSAAYKQDGLLMILFDESVGDSTACCGEMPGPGEAMPGLTGLGGGITGAVLLSPFIAPGTQSTSPYNHYSMLGSVEDLFGLQRIAYATGTSAFGSDVYTKSPVKPVLSGLKLKPRSFGTKTHKPVGTTISYTDSEAGRTTFTVQRMDPGYRVGHQSCKVLKHGHKRPKHSKACTVTKKIGSFTHQDIAGLNSFHFTGKVNGHALATGSYSLQAASTFYALKGATKTATFKII